MQCRSTAVHLPCRSWHRACYSSTQEPHRPLEDFVKKILSLSSLATLAIALGMISWGSAAHAQSTATPSDQQTPQTQPSQPSPQNQPSPEMPPADQKPDSSQTPTSQQPS